MKKISTLFSIIAFLFVLGTMKVSAQQQIQILVAGDSSFTPHCLVPDSVELDIYGNASGYANGDSVELTLNFGDGTDTTFMSPIYSQWSYFFAAVFHTYTLPGVYSVQFIATGPNGATDTMIDNSVLIGQCEEISGKLYADANNDCVYNTGDTTIQSYVGAYIGNDLVAFTGCDSAGNYVLSVPAITTYQIKPYFINQVNVSCPNSSQYTVGTFPSTGNDFGITCSNTYDYTGNIYGQGFRNAGNTGFWLQVSNKLLSCLPPTATITLTLDPLTTFVSSYITPTSVSGNQVVFTASQLTNININSFNTSFILATDPSASLGDTLCLSVTIDPISGDADPSDNTITYCGVVRNSCDPNEKLESHVGTGSGIVAPGTELEYTIMFQNVGNDVAFDVSVTDELDSDLDLSTLQITGFSHPNVMTISNNTMKFEFKNINLAAASVNEPMSHGYISYKVSPKTSIALGTAIENTANIIFDFNQAIVTNTVTDIIDLTVGLNQLSGNANFTIYPNPANDLITIATHTSDVSMLIISDITGRKTIQSQEVNDGQTISVKNLQPGMYLTTIINPKGSFTGKLMVK